ncbi:MAG: hypothetical protein AAFY20_12215 [Cyanobacteria bacterium J06639_14]
MDPHQKAKEAELRRREAEIKARELQIRMRELEAELEETPVHPTYKHEAPPPQKRIWYKQLPNIVKFSGIAVAGIVAVVIANWLITAVLIAGVAWVGYKLFLEGDRS